MPADRRPTARAAVLPARRAPLELGRLAPSGRSILVGLALLALGVGGYVAARETSVFAVRTILVRGAPPHVRAEVRAALADEAGRSLLRVDAAGIERRLADVPDVESVQFDRAFPNTLRIVVVPARPVVVLRHRADAWLVSAHGRVLRRLNHPRLSLLPRVWVKSDPQIVIGSRLGANEGGAAAAALAPLASANFRGGVLLVRTGAKELTLVLRSGIELRLGDLGDLRLKLAIARRILALPATSGTKPAYLDVSVPERPVMGADTQVSGLG